MFFPAILIPACTSSSLAFHIMYSAYKLNAEWQYTGLVYSFPNLEQVRCSMSGSNCCFLTCIQVSQDEGVRWSTIPISWRIFHSLLWFTQSKGFSVVNEAKVDIFLEFSCFLYEPINVGNLISGSSAFSKSSLNIWNFLVHILLKAGLENFERYFASMWNECNCVIIWTFFGIGMKLDSLASQFFFIGVKTDLSQSSGHCWVFQLCWHIECSTFTASSFRVWNSSAGILSPPLSFVRSDAF